MRSNRQSKSRSGIALPTALGAIVLIGVMVSGVFYMSTQELRASTSAAAQERAFRAAEYGLNQTVGDWDNVAMGLLQPGAVVTNSYSGAGWGATVRITKLSPHMYSLVSNSSVDAGPLGTATRMTGLSLRTLTLDLNFSSALTVRGEAKIGGSSFISGNDWNPATWGDCPATGDPLAGVAVQKSSDINWAGCPSFNCVEGLPKILVTDAAGDTTNYFTFGDLDWADLTSMATHTFPNDATLSQIEPKLTTTGRCDYSHHNNWGEPWHQSPTHACENHFPIIHFKQDAVLSGGRGQGILLVDGDLKVGGGFEFYGPVIVRGTLNVEGQSGSKLNGAVMAANVNLDQSTVLGDATVRYSDCAVTRAKQAAAVPRRVTQRAWVEGL